MLQIQWEKENYSYIFSYCHQCFGFKQPLAKGTLVSVNVFLFLFVFFSLLAGGVCPSFEKKNNAQKQQEFAVKPKTFISGGSHSSTVKWSYNDFLAFFTSNTDLSSLQNCLEATAIITSLNGIDFKVIIS